MKNKNLTAKGKTFSSPAFRVFLTFLILIALISLFIIRVKEEMIDFEVNYKAGKRLRMGETLYRIDDEHYMFKYLPSSAFLYLPLSTLPLSVAKAIWFFIVILCFFSLVYISNKLLPSKKRKSLYILIIPPLILAKFFLREIQLGQINVLVALILLIMIWSLSPEKKESSPKRKTCAGLLWGLATALKPYALIFFPYFLLKKKSKSLLSGIGFLTLAIFAPSLYYGFQGNIIVFKEWISTLSKSTLSLLSSQDNISIISFFVKWTGNQSISLVLSGLVIALLCVLVLIVVLRGRKIAQASVLECSILLILIPLVSPLGWDYTLLMSVLGIMIIIRHFFNYSKFWRVILIVNFSIISFSLYDVMGKEFYAMFMSWSVTTISFLIIIGYLVYLRLSEIC